MSIVHWNMCSSFFMKPFGRLKIILNLYLKGLQTVPGLNLHIYYGTSYAYTLSWCAMVTVVQSVNSYVNV